MHTVFFDAFDEAATNLSRGAFNESESGTYRIFAVYSVDWNYVTGVFFVIIRQSAV